MSLSDHLKKKRPPVPAVRAPHALLPPAAPRQPPPPELLAAIARLRGGQ